MKGYKAMDENMQCRGMQFEIGKSYHVDGEIELCKNGLHFCKKLSDVFVHYPNNGKNRFFEVEANGHIDVGTTKCAASDLTIVRELTDVEVNVCYYNWGNGCGDGYGKGCGKGYGYGFDDDYICGTGCGDGYGYGYASEYGHGHGNGYDYCYAKTNIQKILKFKEM